MITIQSFNFDFFLQAMILLYSHQDENVDIDLDPNKPESTSDRLVAFSVSRHIENFRYQAWKSGRVYQ